jgi:hypothetical protein
VLSGSPYSFARPPTHVTVLGDPRAGGDGGKVVDPLADLCALITFCHGSTAPMTGCPHLTGTTSTLSVPVDGATDADAASDTAARTPASPLSGAT